MFRCIKTLLFCVAAAVVGTVPLVVQANDFTLEGKTVTWIVGFSEGGGTDRLTRVLQTKLSDHLPGNPNVIVLNRPGGGSVIASNNFHKNAPADGTMLIMASTSTLLPVLLGSKVAEYDPNEWVAITGFARGATMYAISDELGLSGTDMQADYEALKSANIRFGTETPLSAELLDFVSMEMLGVDARYVFGLSSKDAEAAFQRAEMNVNTDNTRSYLKDYGDDPKVNPVWSYGVIDNAGQLQRDPDLPDIPTFPEFYEVVMGEAPSGTAHELQKSLMNAKVMLSKAVMLPRGTPGHIRDVYIEALKAVTSEPDVVAALPREIGSMPLNFGDETQRAMALGTQMAPEVRAWAALFLEERFDTSLD